MFILYDFVFLVFAVIWLPVYFFKRKFHPGFSRRLGFLPREESFDRPIWVHAVSVGEAMAAKKLIQQLKESFPLKKIVISTVTATGNKIVKDLASLEDFITFLPLDFSFTVKSVIDKINPGIFIILETEIWPNLISYLSKKAIPVVIVNGRISDSSFRGYSLIKFLLCRVLNKLSLYCVQTQTDAARLRSLGLLPEKIQVTGNMKFDISGEDIGKERYLMQREKLGLRDNEQLLIAASTHQPEEEYVLSAYKELLKDFPLLRLLIAPRHPERSFEVERLVSRQGLRSIYFSKLADCPTCITQAVFILDSIGKLMSFYPISDIVFMGGSLAKKGGHNILEPALCARPIIFGPHMFNFRDIAGMFLKEDAAIKIEGREGLEEAVAYLLNNPDKASGFGERAKGLIKKNQGSTQENIRAIKSLLA
ncbi:MAG: 3-deoxy-D-manno-octulosonic acid transferase [Candidatus Omnitrophota bacterium]